MSSLSALSNFYQRLFLILPFATEPYNYDNPSEWPLTHPTCEGLRQSPIAIYSNKVSPLHMPPLVFGLYDIPLRKKPLLRNNGHTVEFEVPETIAGEKPFIIGGLLERIFIAEGVHFHWGSEKQAGSEHLINGRQYDMEMHIVHRNTKYRNLKTASSFPDGIAVMAVLFKTVHSESVYYPGLNELYNTLEDLDEFNSTAHTSHKISLGSLLGNINGENFYTYRGSLTTPPCLEVVTWVVFPEVLPISFRDLPKFWKILDSRGKRLVNNFRPTQALHYRKVYQRQPLTKTSYWL